LTSFVVTTRLTGGENLMFGLIFTVTVLPSDEISGGPDARSGCAVFGSSGLNEYSGRWIA